MCDVVIVMNKAFGDTRSRDVVAHHKPCNGSRRDRAYARLVSGASMAAIPWWGGIVYERGMFLEMKAPYFEAR